MGVQAISLPPERVPANQIESARLTAGTLLTIDNYSKYID